MSGITFRSFSAPIRLNRAARVGKRFLRCGTCSLTLDIALRRQGLAVAALKKVNGTGAKLSMAKSVLAVVAAGVLLASAVMAADGEGIAGPAVEAGQEVRGERDETPDLTLGAPCDVPCAATQSCGILTPADCRWRQIALARLNMTCHLLADRVDRRLCALGIDLDGSIRDSLPHPSGCRSFDMIPLPLPPQHFIGDLFPTSGGLIPGAIGFRDRVPPAGVMPTMFDNGDEDLPRETGDPSGFNVKCSILWFVPDSNSADGVDDSFIYVAYDISDQDGLPDGIFNGRPRPYDADDDDSACCSMVEPPLRDTDTEFYALHLKSCADLAEFRINERNTNCVYTAEDVQGCNGPDLILAMLIDEFNPPVLPLHTTQIFPPGPAILSSAFPTADGQTGMPTNPTNACIDREIDLCAARMCSGNGERCLSDADCGPAGPCVRDPLANNVELVIKRVESSGLFGPHTVAMPDSPEALENRLALSQLVALLRADTDADDSPEESAVVGLFTPTPYVEVKKHVRCCPGGVCPPPVFNPKGECVANCYEIHEEGMPGNGVLPGSRFEFRIEVENTGNVPLTVTLQDVLEEAMDPVPGTLSVCLFRENPGPDCIPNAAACPGTDLGGTAGPGCLITVTNASAQMPQLNSGFLVMNDGFLDRLNGELNCLGVLKDRKVCGEDAHHGDRVVIKFQAQVAAADTDFCNEIHNSITAIGDPDLPSEPGPMGNLNCPAFNGNEVYDRAAVIDTVRENEKGADDNVVTIDIKCRDIDLNKEVRRLPDGTFSKNANVGGEPNDPVEIEYRYRIRNDGELPESMTLVDHYLCCDVVNTPGVSFLMGACDLCTQPGINPTTCGSPTPPKGSMFFTLLPGAIQDITCAIRFENQAAVSAFNALDNGRTGDCGDDMLGTLQPDCYRNYATVTAYADPYIREPFGVVGVDRNGLADTVRLMSSDDQQLHPAPNISVGAGQAIVAAGPDRILQTLPAGDDQRTMICPPFHALVDHSCADICPCVIPVDKRVRCIEAGNAASPDVCDTQNNCGVPFGVDDNTSLLAVAASSNVQFSIYIDYDGNPMIMQPAFCQLCFQDVFNVAPAEIMLIPNTARLCRCGSTQMCCNVSGFNANGNPVCVNDGNCGFAFPFEDGQCLELTFNARIAANASAAPPDPCNMITVIGSLDVEGSPCSGSQDCFGNDSVCVDIRPHPAIVVNKRVECIQGCEQAPTFGATLVESLDVVPHQLNGAQVRFQIDIDNVSQPSAPGAGDAVSIGEVCLTDHLTPACRPWVCEDPAAGDGDDNDVCESLTACIRSTPGAGVPPPDFPCTPGSPNYVNLTSTLCGTPNLFNIAGSERCFALPPGVTLDPGETLTIYFDLSVPSNAASRMVCLNEIDVVAYRTDTVCPPAPPAVGEDSANVTVKLPDFECEKDARAFNDCGLSTPFTTNLTLPCDVDYPLTIEYRLRFHNKPTSQTPAYDIMLCDPQLVADAVAAGLTVQNCALCSGACDGVNDTCANFPGPLNPGQTVTALCRFVVPSHSEWENFAGRDLELDPGGANALNDYHNSSIGQATGRLGPPNQCGMRTLETGPCTSRVRIAEPCELEVIKRARCIIEDANPNTDDCLAPQTFGPYQNDLLQVAPGSLVQFETIVENIGDKAGICMLKFTDLLTQQPGDILPCGSVQIGMLVNDIFIPLPPSPPLPACFGLPNFTRAAAGDLGCDPAMGCSQMSECNPATELGCCELNPANYPSVFPGGQFQPGQKIALRYNARIPATPTPVHCPGPTEPNHQCVNPTDCPAVNPPIDCPPDPVNTAKVEGRCCPPSPTSEYQCCDEDSVALNILDLDICCEKAYTQIKWDSDADCTNCGTCVLEPTDRTDPLEKPATGAPIDLTGYVFPAELTVIIEGHNYSEVPVNLQAVDLSLANHAALTPGVSVLTCQFGQVRLNVPPGGMQVWTCTLRIDSHEAGRLLSMRDDSNPPVCPSNQCVGDPSPNVYRNWAKVVATPAMGSTVCSFVKEEYCCKSLKFTPCEVNVQKTVRCLTGCPPDGALAGIASDCLVTLPGEHARFEVRLDYPLVNSMGTPSPADDMPNPKLPVVCIQDLLTCSSSSCPSSIRAMLVPVGGPPIDVTTDFSGLSVANSRQCFRLNSLAGAMRPWLLPGESLVISFDVRVDPNFMLPGPAAQCPSTALPCAGSNCQCPEGQTPTCCNTVVVEGYTEGCPLTPPPLPTTDRCRDCDCTSMKVRDAEPVCRKCLYVDLGGNGSVEESCCSDGSSDRCVIDAPQFPLRLRYEFTVRNEGNTELANVCLCDKDNVVDLLLAAGATIVGTCGLNANSDCSGAGNDCVNIACLAPGASHTVSCEFQLMNEGQLNALFGNNNTCFSNHARARGTPLIGQPAGTCNNLNNALPCHVGTPTDWIECGVDLCPDVCRECPCTKVQIDIWNENEVRFSGTERCICVWDQTLLSEYTSGGVANHFQLATLQTPKGKARINGVASTVCPGDTINAPLIGIAAKRVHFNSGDIEWAGSSLIGSGEEPGCIEYTPVGGVPDESVLPDQQAPRSVTPPAVDLVAAAGLAEATPLPAYTDDGQETLGGLTIEQRAGISKKGSLLVWPKVELKWNSAGQLIQDTYLQITNDYPGEVKVHFYFAHGDEETPAVYVGFPPQLLEPSNPGCIWVDVEITLSQDESAYWSAATGLPKGVSPFSVLDPGSPPGRPDMDPLNPGGRVLRGYVIGWAVHGQTKREIRWNHLLGHAMLVNYQNSVAWDYRAWSFQTVEGALGINGQVANHGDRLATPGRLHLDGSEYEYPPSQLVFDFFAVNAPIFSGPMSALIGDTDLTLWIAKQSYTRQ